MTEQTKMRDIYEVPIDERDLLNMDVIHDYLRVTLGFPEHYGKNLSALADCLGDISEPTRLYVMRDATMDPDSDYAMQMDRLCMVLLRSARENPMLSVSINTVRWPSAG
ncbi:MAG: barstar family protein [Atopobiaceae bacterium]|nr:barstar family protein [Atopobiaceae bacterium]